MRKTYKVVLSRRAIQDLREIRTFVRRYGAERSKLWLSGMKQTVLSLEHFPYRGTMTPESHDFRRLLYGEKPNNYRIIYEIDEATLTVNVLHIRHGSRAPFRPEDVI